MTFICFAMFSFPSFGNFTSSLNNKARSVRHGLNYFNGDKNVYILLYMHNRMLRNIISDEGMTESDNLIHLFYLCKAAF